jgi:alginate O-acetyltransferase complex protein AlgI
MREPIRARSLSEFWGRRWNVAFPQLAGPLWFEPMRRRFGVSAATLAVFAISGLLHELVISVPAGAGYGLPMLYFLVQGAGVCVEQRHQRALGRSWTLAVVVGPAFWLFHPAFVERVVIPFMEAARAL